MVWKTVLECMPRKWAPGNRRQKNHPENLRVLVQHVAHHSACCPSLSMLIIFYSPFKVWIIWRSKSSTCSFSGLLYNSPVCTGRGWPEDGMGWPCFSVSFPLRQTLLAVFSAFAVGGYHLWENVHWSGKQWMSDIGYKQLRCCCAGRRLGRK